MNGGTYGGSFSFRNPRPSGEHRVTAATNGFGCQGCTGAFTIKIYGPRERFRVGFRFTQNGYPRGHKTIRVTSGGAGNLFFDEVPPDDVSTGVNEARGSAVHIDHIPDIGTDTFRVAFIATNTSYRERGRVRIIDVSSTVTKSDNPRCPVGGEVDTHLVDGGGAKPDRIFFSADVGECKRIQEKHFPGARNKIRVVIQPPKAVPL